MRSARITSKRPRRIRRVVPETGSPSEERQADLGAWRLPSGKALAQFALEGGFLAPGLMQGRLRRDGEPVAGETRTGS